MARPAVVYVCSNCDSQFPKWSGRCAECGQWGALIESAATGPAARKASVPAGKTVPLHSLSAAPAKRYPLGVDEVDRVFGGGLVPGSVVLLGGDPGVGKSTLVLQLAQAVARAGRAVLYVSGEESAEQVAARLRRLPRAAGPIEFLAETNIETILSTIEAQRPQLVVIDSIQTMAATAADGEPGSLQQIRAAAAQLIAAAKSSDRSIILIGHVTKEGAMAGPKALEHLVDVVLYLEGDTLSAHRLLRAVKNRFGSTNEVGVFDMTHGGLVEVANPSRLFLTERQSAPGAVATVVLEGSRPFALEVQALVNPTVFGLPRRTASGLDFNRLQVLVAVLTRRGGLKLATQDVFVNVVGGLKIRERAVDLAACLAIASSCRDRPIPPTTVAVGEVGLGGEIRSAPQMDRRLSEAAQLGFTVAIVPAATTFRAPSSLRLQSIANLKEALVGLGN